MLLLWNSYTSMYFIGKHVTKMSMNFFKHFNSNHNMGNELCMTYLTDCYDKLYNNPPQ